MNENQNSGLTNQNNDVPQNSTGRTSTPPTYETYSTMRAAVDEAYAKAEAERTRRKQMVKDAAKGVSLWAILPLTFAFGILICEMMLRTSYVGVGLTVVVLAAYAIHSYFIIKRDRERLKQTALLAIPVGLLAVSFAFNASFNGKTWMILLLISLVMILNVVMSGSTGANSVFSIDAVRDAAYSHLAAPFVNIRPAFGGLFERSREEKNGSSVAGNIGKVIVGLVVSIPVVLILGKVLVGADAVFENFISGIIEKTDKLDISFGRIFGDIVIGALTCLFGIPLVMGLRSGYVREHKAVKTPRWLDSVIGATVAYAASVVYILFVGVQISYFFPVSISYYFGNYDFTKRLTLPDNMTWAEYARSGFFELSGIIIASFAAIAFFMIFSRRNEKGHLPAYLKTALTIIAACNVIMSVSAVMRMGLYTIWCGLTAKRIGVLMIIAVITISLAAVIIKLWQDRFPLVKVVGVAALCAAVCFGCMNVERVCANVNVDRHIEQGTSIDICYLGNLSYAAAPAVERLMEESPDENVRAAAAGIIAKYYYHGHGNLYDMGGGRLIDCSAGEMTVDHWRAYYMCLTDADEEGKRYLWVTEDMIENYGIYAQWQDEKRDHERWHDSEFMSFEEYRKEHSYYWYYRDYRGW